MSLIHDALKKAQEKTPASPHTQKQNIPPSTLSQHDSITAMPQQQASKRTLILGILAMVAIGYFVFVKFFQSPGPKVSKVLQQHTATANKSVLQSLKNEALQAYRENDLDTAWAKYVAASSVQEKDPEVWNNLGVVLRKRGEVEKAREAYQKALELRSDYPEALHNFAVLEFEEGNREMAQETLQKVTKLRPQYAEAHFHQALLAEEAGEMELALAAYKKALSTGGHFSDQFLDRLRSHVMAIEP